MKRGISIAIAALAMSVLGITAASSGRVATPPGGPSSAQLQRAHRQVVDAKRQGPAALKRLVLLVEHRPRAASASDVTGPTTDQQALAVALWQDGSVVGDTGVIAAPAFRARAASCWGRQGSYRYHTIGGGAIVARIQKWNNGWCGNGSTISYGAYNFDHHVWSQYPYCQTNQEERQGWDGSSGRWAHGGAWSTNGILTGALVCLPILGGWHATVRVTATGYWDTYDDYGF